VKDIEMTPQTELPRKVKIVEVGPRDGLQNEKETIPANVKVELIDRLTRAGFANIEAASFVSPKWVPQMATSADVMAAIARRDGVIYSALTPNLHGFEAARAARADEVVIFGSASEAFSQKNINCSIAESIARFEGVAKAAKEHGLRLRGSISCAFGCPYQGDVALDAVADVVGRMRDLGCDEIDIADTIGVATPRKTQAVMLRAAQEFFLDRISGHFHDTYGQALANIYASLEVGVSIFHSSVAGLGGCPYAKGATGNVATEDVLYLMQGLGIATGIDLDAVVDAGQFISQHLGRKSASRAGNAIAAKRA
jgi:hydroxymethylglutaryl-CoA lyase